VGDIPVVFEQASVKVQPKKSLWRRVLRRGPSAKAIAAADAINKELPEVRMVHPLLAFVLDTLCCTSAACSVSAV
jgi:hypothetical protein